MDLLGRARALAGAGVGGEGVLGDVPAPSLLALAERVRVIELGPGGRASTRRDGTDFVLVVAAGTVRAGGDADAGAAACAIGELVGARGAVAGGAAIELVAAEAATLVEIAVDDFLDVLVEHAAASAALARGFAAALRRTPR